MENVYGFVRSLALAIALLVVALSAEVRAQYVHGSFVTNDNRGRGILKLTYVEECAGTADHGSMHITLASSGPSKSDRHVTVAFQIKYGSSRAAQSVMYRRPMLLAQGATSVTSEIPHFLISSQYSFGRVFVFEDGRNIVDEDDSSQPMGLGGVQDWRFYKQNSNQTVSCNMIMPTEMSMNRADRDLNMLIIQPGKVTLGPLSPIPATPLVASAEMAKRARYVASASSDWRYYYGSDIVGIPLEALIEIEQRRPEVADALLKFVVSGGHLHVMGANEEKARQAIDKWLGGGQSSTPIPNTWKSRSWQVPDGNMFSADVVSGAVASSRFSPIDGLPEVSEATQVLAEGDDSNASLTTISQTGPSARSLSCSDRQFFLGSVTAAEEFEKLPWVPSSVLINAGNDGNWFWRNLILSVGKPPVWTFCAIVALFGAILGPGLLILTGRLKRRSLMILLVPSISLAATLAIIAYGVFHEGFGTSIRVTGVIAIDGVTGKGFAWSRQNYFSGLIPRNGLAFGASTLVRPVINESDSPRGSPSGGAWRPVSTYVDLIQDKQVWRNWLRARQQQQMLVGHPIQTRSPISVRAASTSGGVLIANFTDEQLPIVIVRDASDSYYVTESLAAKSEVIAQRTDLATARVAAARARVTLRPAAPAELLAAGNSLLSFGRSRRGWSNLYGQDSLPDIINSAHNQFLSENLSMPPMSFVTVVKNLECVEIPLDGEITESMLLVVGTAKW